MHAPPTDSAPNEVIGEALVQFDRALSQFRERLAPDPKLEAGVFDGSGNWIMLLRHKLAPHFAGEGCLIVAVAGGTNSGKSTIFNMLAGGVTSPVRATAAATCHPVIAGSPMRIRQCLEGALIPEFRPRHLEDDDAVLSREAPDDAVFVAENAALPDKLVLLDTPDVDSIDKQNWVLAEAIRAAGDVVVAVVTPEKYKDDRVVTFFREAAASGRLVVPLINKADPTDDFEVAREQLAEFAELAGVAAPRFAVPHDFRLAKDPARPIESLGDEEPLRDYLLALDGAAIRERVFGSTVHHFAEQAQVFVDRARDIGEMLASAVHDWEERAKADCRKYDPAPGPAIGGLFHEFVQEKRGPFRRAIGSVSTQVSRRAFEAGRVFQRAFMSRASLEHGEEEETLDRIQEQHARAIEQITRDLTRGLIETSRNMREPAAHLLQGPVSRLDTGHIIQAVRRDVLADADLSVGYRTYARNMLEKWWADETGKRRALEALDLVLAATPIAIAAPMTALTGGFGVAETVTITAGPLAEQFIARVAEYQFGDQMFDFISPWRDEQRQKLYAALETHLLKPALADVLAYAVVFEDNPLYDMQVCLDALKKAQPKASDGSGA